MQSHTETFAQTTTTTLSMFFARIYAWMFLGLLVSALFSYITIATSLGKTILTNPILFYGIAGIELAILLGVQFLINKLPAHLSRLLFILYAALNGITLAWIFYSFTFVSVIGVFLISAGLFGVLALIGYTTKKDLSGWRTFLFIGMLGVFVSSIVNIFLQNSLFDTLVSGAAILVFAGLTVYDNQVYKAIFHANKDNPDALKKQATLGALLMYVNFIMIFINLLKFLGIGRD